MACTEVALNDGPEIDIEAQSGPDPCGTKAIHMDACGVNRVIAAGVQKVAARFSLDSGTIAAPDLLRGSLVPRRLDSAGRVAKFNLQWNSSELFQRQWPDAERLEIT